MPKETLNALLDRRLITGERMMLAHVYLKKGCVVPRHSHENEQLTYILEGALHFWLGEDETEEVVVRAGEVLTSRRTCRTRRWRSRTRSTWTSSARRGRTGSTTPTPTCAGADHGPGAARARSRSSRRSSQGLGRAIADELAAEGASVVICARGEERLLAGRGARSRAATGARVLPVAADVSKPADVQRLVGDGARGLRSRRHPGHQLRRPAAGPVREPRRRGLGGRRSTSCSRAPSR